MKQFIEVTNGKNGTSRQIINTNHIALVSSKDSYSEEDVRKMEDMFPHGNCCIDVVMGLSNDSCIVKETYDEIKGMLAD